MLRAELLERRQGLVVVGHQVVGAEEDVELVEPEAVGPGVEIDRVEDQVEVVAPVVHLGHVGVLERVLDGQRVEMEDVAQRRLDPLIRVRFGVFDVDPEGPLAILERLADPAGGASRAGVPPSLRDR